MRVAGRIAYGPGNGNYDYGFRCVSGSNFTSGASAGGDFTSDEGASLPLAGNQGVITISPTEGSIGTKIDIHIKFAFFISTTF